MKLVEIHAERQQYIELISKETKIIFDDISRILSEVEQHSCFAKTIFRVKNILMNLFAGGYFLTSYVAYTENDLSCILVDFFLLDV